MDVMVRLQHDPVKACKTVFTGLGIKGEELSGILVTHEHIDHIQGLGVLSRKYKIPIYGTRGTIEGIQCTASLGKMPEGLFREGEPDRKLKIGGMEGM